MRKEDKTRDELLIEAAQLRRKLVRLETELTERKRAEAISEKRARELIILHKVSLAVSTSLSSQQTSTAVLQGMMDAIQPDFSFLLQRCGDQLILDKVLPPEVREYLDIPHLVGECLCGLAVLEGRPVYSRDIRSDIRCTRDECKLAGIRSFSALPLVNGDEIIGVIGLASAVERDFEAEAGFLETLARQISVAFSNARLYEIALREAADRKLAEEGLRESEERYRALSEATSEGVALTERGVLIDANPQLARMLGYELHEIIGRPVNEFIVPADRELVGRKIEIGDQLPYENRLLRKDGSSLTVETRARHFVYKGQDVRVTALHDVSMRKRAEEEREKFKAQLFQAQKMEAIGTLAGGIAHDFNNILAGIIGFAELLSMFHLADDDQARDFVDQILNGAYRARDLAQQILTISRERAQNKMPVQLDLLIKEAAKFLRASLPATIEIRRAINCQEACVFADPIQMHQVVMNLCANAAHAMREKGGVLEIRLDEAQWDVDVPDSEKLPDLVPGSYWKLIVSDTGHGMSERVMEKIFDPYFSTKQPEEGTGLGLAVVHGIVKNHVGAISVHSEVGKGTTFEVFLPRLTMGGADSAEEQEEMLPEGTGCILFVDDEEFIVQVSKRALENLGYEVVGETSSILALEIFIAQPDRFDLVITDLTMPDMTGMRLAREILKERAEVPIILCSGFDAKGAPEQAQAIGIRRFLRKPVGIRRLAETIRDVFDQRN